MGKKGKKGKSAKKTKLCASADEGKSQAASATPPPPASAPPSCADAGAFSAPVVARSHESLTDLPADALNEIIFLLAGDASDLYHVDCLSRCFHRPTQQLVGSHPNNDVIHIVSLVQRALRRLSAAAGRPVPWDLPRSPPSKSWTHLLLWQLSQGILLRHIGGGPDASAAGRWAVAAGQYHSLFVTADGSAYSCGGACPDDDMAYGALGLGHLHMVADGEGRLPSRMMAVPRRIAGFGGRSVRSVSAGGSHSLFLTDDGAVYSCGWHFPCGLGAIDEETYTPRRIMGQLADKRVVAMAAGRGHSLFVSEDGQCYSCGGGGSCSELGHGAIEEVEEEPRTPRLIEAFGGMHVVSVAAGDDYSLFLLIDGSVYSCGSNDEGNDGRLGIGYTNSKQHLPRRITAFGQEGLPTICAIAAGSDHSLFLAETGVVFSCGLEADCALGHGEDEVDCYVPTPIRALDGVRVQSITAHSAGSFFVADDGSVYACGSNRDGALGFGQGEEERSLPERIEALADVQVHTATSGGEHACFLTRSGQVLSVGDGRGGNLGHNYPPDSEDCIEWVPRRIEGLPRLAV